MFCTMADHGGGGSGQRPGEVTPPRASSAGAEQRSPAGTRSRVSAIGVPMVDVSEHYNHEELVQQVREVKAVMRVLGVATEEILAKHNVFVGDVEQGMDGLM